MKPTCRECIWFETCDYPKLTLEHLEDGYIDESVLEERFKSGVDGCPVFEYKPIETT